MAPGRPPFLPTDFLSRSMMISIEHRVQEEVGSIWTAVVVHIIVARFSCPLLITTHTRTHTHTINNNNLHAVSACMHGASADVACTRGSAQVHAHVD